MSEREAWRQLPLKEKLCGVAFIVLGLLCLGIWSCVI